jgi:ABC-type iron transport system FetAB ATPase subunit
MKRASKGNTKGSRTFRGFLTALLASKDFIKVIDEGITPRYFDGTDKQAYDFVTQFCTRYGKTPSIMTFKKRFPTFQFEQYEGRIGTEEPLTYWCDEVRRIKKHNTLASSVMKAGEMLSEQYTEEALKVIQTSILKINNEINKPDNMKLQDTVKRLANYEKAKTHGGVTGLTTGNPDLDDMIGGLNNGELTTIMGYTGIGKSFLLVLIAVCLAKLGYRVLLGTTEMSLDMMFRRVDAVWNKLDYSRFKIGKLTIQEEKRYKKYLKEMETTDKFLVIEQLNGGVSQVSAKIEQHNPDIVLIDGAYLLEDEEGDEDNHAGKVRIWNGLHQICLDKNKPMCVTTQSKDESGTSLKSINFAKALATATDNFLSLEQTKQMRYDKEITIKPLKLREGELLYSLTTKWDFNAMDFSTVYTSDGRDELAESADKPKGVIINA